MIAILRPGMKITAIETLACDAGWRINHGNWYKPAITDLEGVRQMGRDVREKGFSALKTNLFLYENGRPKGWRPGFGAPFYPELNVDRKVLQDLRMHLEALREGGELVLSDAPGWGIVPDEKALRADPPR